MGAYEALAAGGFSAVCVGATCVRWEGLINERMFGIYDDTYIISHRELVEVIHNNGALAGIQLFYGGLIVGAGATTPLEPGKGWIPGTVSQGPSGKYPIGNQQPGVVTTEEYDQLVEDFAQAARRAKEAGYDYVSYHFCHGSLPHVTLSLLENQGRNDVYADRFLFCERIIQRAQELCGSDYPQIPRMVCEENFEGGYDVEYFIEHYATRLHALGIDAMDCTFGSMLPAKSRSQEVTSGEVIGGGFYVPNLVALPYIKRMREGLKARGIDMPLMGSCNINTPDQMREMIGEGAADFFTSCRQSLDDPDFPRKIAEGREEEIRKSTRTGASLLAGNIFNKGIAGSAQNAAFSRDRDYRIIPTTRPKRVFIAGGGSGGMEYAITADEIGHDVTLFEKSDVLGGVMNWAGNYRTLRNMEQIAYQPEWHRVMIGKSKVKVHLNTELTVEKILAEKPDVVVVATGAVAAFARCCRALMRRSPAALPARSTARWAKGRRRCPKARLWSGAQQKAIELALDLARAGRKVRLLEPAATFAPTSYIGSRTRYVMMWAGEVGLTPETGVALDSVGDGTITVAHADGRKEEIACAVLVVSPGRVAYDPISTKLAKAGIQVQVVGDARKPRSYGNSIHEAAYLARNI